MDAVDLALKRARERGALVADSLLSQEAVLPFGVFALDHLLLHVGGIPEGRVAELFGYEGSWKSTLGLRVAASGQQRHPDRLATVIDTEGNFQDKFGLFWAQRNGIDLSRLPLYPVHNLDDVCQTIYELVHSGDYHTIVWDSLAQSAPRDMMEAKKQGKKGNNPVTDLRDWGEKRAVAEEARKITELVKAITVPCMHTKTTLVIINQVRDSLVLNAMRSSSPTITTPGGRAAKFTHSLRLFLESAGPLTIKEGAGQNVKRVPIGHLTNAEVVKCKFAGTNGFSTGVNTPGPMRLYNSAHDPVDESADVMYAAEHYGIVVQAGAWYDWPDAKIKAQGRDNFLQRVAEEDKFELLAQMAIAKIRETHTVVATTKGFEDQDVALEEDEE